MARLRILFVVSECVPLIKTGGLGDVAGALPGALFDKGHDVRVLMPRYREVKDYPAKRLPAPLGVATGVGERWCALYQAALPSGVPIYLLEHDALYDREGVYGDKNGDFGDNLLRFALLSRAALTLGGHVGWSPELFHIHDWQSALVSVYARWLRRREPCVMTIHNLGYQGLFAGADHHITGLSADATVALGAEQFGNLNLLKAGIVSATRLSTVSPRYASEIQTPSGGAGLDGELRARGNALVGILNGIDDAYWDPQRDSYIAANYGPGDMHGKRRCKAALQRELGLAVRADVPLIGLVSRFAHQKGIDIFAKALVPLLEMDLQVAVLGSGERWAHELFGKLSFDHPRFKARLGYDEGLAHRIEAGADLFAMPSRYEPCGLNQLYSQRYGTLPVVRWVGGLADTVEHGVNGFVFHELSPSALANTIAYACHVYREQPRDFAAMQRFAMRKPMGWDRAASQYEALYRLALRA